MGWQRRVNPGSSSHMSKQRTGGSFYKFLPFWGHVDWLPIFWREYGMRRCMGNLRDNGWIWIRFRSRYGVIKTYESMKVNMRIMRIIRINPTPINSPDLMDN